MNGTLLDGRVRHTQPPGGHRTAIEPVLLAAAVPARDGDRVIEAGTGSGAALLCLRWRVPGITGVGIERDAEAAEAARANIASNLFASLSVIEADLAQARPDGRFDHAMANPPWHGIGTASPDPRREAARRAGPDLLADWTRCLAGWLRHRGTLTLVLGTAALPRAVAAVGAAGCGSLAMMPLWPRQAVPAKLVLLQAVRGGRAPFRLLPGLVLHEADGAFTTAAQTILRYGGGLAP